MMDGDEIALTIIAIVLGYLLYSVTASVIGDPEPPDPMLYIYKGKLNGDDDTNRFEVDE